MDFFTNPYYLQIATFVVLNCILALGLYITLATGQLSLGHAGFMSIGAYTSVVLTKQADWPFIIAILIGALVAGLFALIIGGPTLRLQGLYLAIATLGIGEVIRVVLLNVKSLGGALGIHGIPSLGSILYGWLKAVGLDGLWGLKVPQVKALLVFLFTTLVFLLIVLLLARLMNSRIGRAFHAISADETAAKTMGINLAYYKMLSFILGAIIAGLAGGLYAHATTFISPKDFSYHRMVEILSFAVIGGSETILGPIFGALLLTTLPEVLRFLADYKMMFYGAIMILVMAFRPQGLIDATLLKKLKRSKRKAKPSVSKEGYHG